jgi:hypothetical protein
MQRARELWWLNPAYVVGIMGALLATASYIVPEWMYRAYWHTPKFIDGEQFRITLACIGMFVVGAAAGGYRRFHGSRPPDEHWAERIPWRLTHRLFNACFYLSLIGYAVWAGAAVSRGASLQLALGVLHGEKGASDEMKEVYLKTISGVTTLTQLGIVVMILGVLIGVTHGWRRVVPKCTILVLITLVRALMNSERLSLMELLIPTVVLLVRLVAMESPRFVGRLWQLLRAAPAVGYSGLIVVFGAAEYFRSWINYYKGGDLSFWQFVSLRLLGYYVTALNNGALLTQRIDPTGAPFFTLHFLWRFPILSGLVESIYPNLAIASEATDPYMRFLQVEANPEFNNGGGFLLPMLDFGFAGALLYWLLAGLLCGILYRSFQLKRTTGLLLYPLTFLGAIELTRIIYWAEGRVLVPIIVLIAFGLACAYYARQQEQMEWQPSH